MNADCSYVAGERTRPIGNASVMDGYHNAKTPTAGVSQWSGVPRTADTDRVSGRGLTGMPILHKLRLRLLTQPVSQNVSAFSHRLTPVVG
jgi:hypothetical protein